MAVKKIFPCLNIRFGDSNDTWDLHIVEAIRNEYISTNGQHAMANLWAHAAQGAAVILRAATGDVAAMGVFTGTWQQTNASQWSGQKSKYPVTFGVKWLWVFPNLANVHSVKRSFGIKDNEFALRPRNTRHNVWGMDWNPRDGFYQGGGKDVDSLEVYLQKCRQNKSEKALTILSR
mgnify:CR=1 FL=1